MSGIGRREFVAGSAAAALAGCGRPQRRKNVLFITVDDLRPDLGCYGEPHIYSPYIDRLAERGQRFLAAFCQQAVCGPSRASMMSGARPDTTGIHTNAIPLREAMPDVVSLPRHFRSHGYETVSLGKIYHHRDDDPEGWSAPPWRPSGDWTGRGYVEESSRRIIEECNSQGRGPVFESTDVADNAYPDGVTTEKALSELRRLQSTPFFLAVGFSKPHLPFNAPKRYWNIYRPDSLVMPEHETWPQGAPELALTNWGELRNYPGVPKQGPVDDDLRRNLIRGYRACVSYMDAQVGRLLMELEKLGLAEDTIVVLWGDHGWKLGDYGAWCKHTNFDIDTRVPLFVSVPGMETARTFISRVVEVVDIYPTLAELCGLHVPGHCEGTSMAPLMENPDRQWKKFAFSQFPRQGGKTMGYSIRDWRWRYTEWIDLSSGEVLDREFYDHRHSHLADTNVVDLPENAQRIQHYSQMLDRGQGWRKIRDSIPEA